MTDASISYQFTSDGVLFNITITDLGDGNFKFEVEIDESSALIGDIRAFYFDVEGNVDASTLDVVGTEGTSFVTGVTTSLDDTNEVIDEGDVKVVDSKDTNLNGEVKGSDLFDVGVEFGDQGMAHGDDYQEVSFILTGADGYTLEDFNMQDIGIRLTSVGTIDGSRDGSLKISDNFEAILVADDAVTISEYGAVVDSDVPEEGSASLNILDNDDDLDGDDATMLTVQSVTVAGVTTDIPADGSATVIIVSTGGVAVYVTIASDGTVTMDPGNAFAHLTTDESDSVLFTYSAVSGTGTVESAGAVITVEGLNNLDDGDETADVFEDSGITALSANALDNVVDPDSDPLNIKIATLAGLALVSGLATAAGDEGGEFTFDEDGNVSFNTLGEFDYLAPGEMVTTSVTYEVSDGDGGMVPSTYTVTVTGVNDAPVAIDNLYEINEGEALTGANIIADEGPAGGIDSDPNGDALVVKTAMGKDANGDLTVDIISDTFVTVYTDGGAAVEVKVDAAGNLEVSENSDVTAGPNGEPDQVSLVYTTEDIPANGDVKESNQANVTVTIADTAAAPEINIVFLLDASRSSVLGQDEFGYGGSDFENTDVNGDGQIGSHFDGSLTLMQSIIDKMALELGANAGNVDIGVYAFEGANAEGTNALNTAGSNALVTNENSVFDLDTDFLSIVNNYSAGASFGSNEVVMEENGNAYYAPALNAAGTFFSVNSESGDAINLVYVMTESLGSDQGFHASQGVIDDLVAAGTLPPGMFSPSDLALGLTPLGTEGHNAIVDTILFSDIDLSPQSALAAIEPFKTSLAGDPLGDGITNIAETQADADNVSIEIATTVTGLVDDLLS